MTRFAKRYREAVADAATYYVAVRLMPWDKFELMGQPAPSPAEHSVGCLMVFNDEAVAREWADGGDVLHILVSNKARPSAEKGEME